MRDLSGCLSCLGALALPFPAVDLASAMAAAPVRVAVWSLTDHHQVVTGQRPAAGGALGLPGHPAGGDSGWHRDGLAALTLADQLQALVVGQASPDALFADRQLQCVAQAGLADRARLADF